MFDEGFDIGSRIRFIGGKYEGHHGVVKKCNPKMVNCQIDGGSKIVSVMRSSVVLEFVDEFGVPNLQSKLKGLRLSTPPTSPKEWSTPPSAVHASPSVQAKMTLGGQEIQKIVLGKTNPNAVHFLKYRFWHRIKTFEILLKKNVDNLPERNFVDFEHHSLVATKIHNDGVEFYGTKKNTLQMEYMVTPIDQPLVDVEAELDKIANFKALPSPRKAASRLELLLSPGTIFPLCVDDFEMIDEPQPSDESGGCGFVSKEMILHFLGPGIDGRRTSSVQVRIFSPQLGVFKGVLTRKVGVTKIQLPPSMLKVGPSTVVADGDIGMAWVLVKTAHPTKNNRKMGEWAKLVHPCRSFVQKRLSPMLERLLLSLHVPPSMLRDYASQTRTWRGRGVAKNKGKSKACEDGEGTLRDEAFVVGVADPTGAIPAGHVVVTGLPPSHTRVFVTRTPCVSPCDGVVLPCLTTRPKGMAKELWDDLAERSFGEIIFSNFGVLGPHGVGLPETIADGDLDGDYYFVCWDANIVATIASMTSSQGDLCEEGEGAGAAEAKCSGPSSARGHVKKEPKCKGEGGCGPGWLAKAQDVMTDIGALHMQTIIGKIYNEMLKISDASPLGMNDPDAALLAIAYKQAIDSGKHGGDINLPPHLRSKFGLSS